MGVNMLAIKQSNTRTVSAALYKLHIVWHAYLSAPLRPLIGLLGAMLYLVLILQCVDRDSVPFHMQICVCN